MSRSTTLLATPKPRRVNHFLRLPRYQQTAMRHETRQRRLGSRRGSDEVKPKPDAAVALSYDRSGDDLPRVVAKGRGAIAAQIIAIAEANGVAVHRDQDLVEILDRLEIDAPIPVAAFAAVAEILAHLYRINDEMSKRRDESTD
jgi:flagellar biosynthesis protein